MADVIAKCAVIYGYANLYKVEFIAYLIKNKLTSFYARGNMHFPYNCQKMVQLFSCIYK